MSDSAAEGAANPEYGMFFPTAQEIRDSINRYTPGSSIHFRLGSPAQQG